MKGSVKRRGNGWMFVVDLPRGEDGKRKQKFQSGFKTKKEAEAELAKLLADIERGNFIEPSKILFGDYLAQWLQDKSSALRKSTWNTYRWLVNVHIIPQLGKHELSKLSPAHLQKFYSKLQQSYNPLSNSAVLQMHRIIRQSLERAMKWGMVAKNVALLVDAPKMKKTEMHVWSMEDVLRFLEVARDDRYYVAFLLAITTGMRKGEILGLRWQDIDFEKEIIMIRQTIVYTGGGKHEFSQPKTDKSKRSITLPVQVIEVLKKHKVRQAEEKLKAGPLYNDQDLVIATQVGTHLTSRNLDRSWYKLREEANVPKIRFHDLRHTHASLMLLQGVHPKIVSERLGHSNIGITLDTYSHVLPGLQEAAAAQFGDALFGGQKDKKKSSV